MATPKITEALAEKLRRSLPQAPLEVVVEMSPFDPAGAGQPRAAWIDAMRTSFEAAAAPVTETVNALGGTVTSMTWLNQTLLVRLPADAVAKLDALDSIQRIDLPHALERDCTDR